MEKYSVLLSLYKHEKPEFLKTALDSMLSQTVAPDEIVIVIDGELTEELYAVLDEYKKNHGIIKTFKNDKNLGLGASLNVGLKKCKNQLVARMDTDDISFPERCEKQLKEFDLNPELSVCGTFVAEFSDDVNKIESIRAVPTESDEIYEFAKRRSPFNHPTVMYKKDDVLSLGGYSSMRRDQDVELFGRMMFNGFTAKNIPEVLLYYRLNKDAYKRRKSKENSKAYIAVIKMFYKMGYASRKDYLKVRFAQTIIRITPIWFQKLIYKKFLRKKSK